jgi:pentatricopeptide repeat protein
VVFGQMMAEPGDGAAWGAPSRAGESVGVRGVNGLLNVLCKGGRYADACRVVDHLRAAHPARSIRPPLPDGPAAAEPAVAVAAAAGGGAGRAGGGDRPSLATYNTLMHGVGVEAAAGRVSGVQVGRAGGGGGGEWALVCVGVLYAWGREMGGAGVWGGGGGGRLRFAKRSPRVRHRRTSRPPGVVIG